MELDALALEYQSDYGSAHRDLDVSYLVNNPEAGGKCRVLSLRFQEQPSDILVGEGTSLLDDRPYAFLVSANPGQPLD